MGAFDNLSDITHAVGNVNLPRVTNPTIRGSIRRHDPDGGHASPYFPSLSGTSLSVQIGGIHSVTINFVSNLMEDAITTINAADPTNLRADDIDGYLQLTNLNGGNKNWLQINSGTAASILGFAIAPEPQSFSGAGDLQTSSPGRAVTSVQNNPQGTQLIAQDEDLTSSVINRAIYGSFRQVERFVKDLDKLVPVWRKFSVTVSVQPVTSNKIFVINNSALRIPIEGFGISGTGPSSFVLDQIVRLKDTNDNDLYDITQSDPVPHISMIIYNDGTIGVADNAHTFATWGTPDGKSIFGAGTKNKQGPVNISSIRGNIIEADTATFQTNVVQVGDTVVIEGATNTTPFSHIGEFVVTEVIDEHRIGVRAKGFQDEAYIGNGLPSELNQNLPGGTVYGTVRVIFGAYVPAQHATFVVPSWVPNGSYTARVLCGVRIRDLVAGDFGSQVSANQEQLATTFYNHITAALSGFRHHTADVDSPAVSGAPNSLSSGTALAQITALLGMLNSLYGGEIAYPGGGNWADGTTNPATTVTAQLTKIVADLAGSTGTGKIEGSAVGGDLIAERLDQQIADLVNNWGKLARANTWTALQTYNAGVSLPFSNSSDTLVLKSLVSSGSLPGFRIYSTPVGAFFITLNASFNGTTWSKDTNGYIAVLLSISGGASNGAFGLYGRVSDTAWTTWTEIAEFSVPQITTGSNQKFDPILALFDAAGNRRIAFDHLGLAGKQVSEWHEEFTYEPHVTIPLNPLLSTDTPTGAGDQASIHARLLQGWNFAANTTPIYYPVTELLPGDILINWGGASVKHSSGAVTNQYDLRYADSGGEHSAGFVFFDNSNNPGNEGIAQTGSVNITSAGRAYYWKATPGGSNLDSINGITVTVIRGRGAWYWVAGGAGGAAATGLTAYATHTLDPNPSGTALGLRVGATTGVSIAYETIANILPQSDVAYQPSTNTIAVFEFKLLDPGNLQGSGANNGTAQFGFYDNDTFISSARGGCYFEKVDANPNWQFTVASDPTHVTRIDTGVVITTGTPVSFRVEMYGDNTEGGNRYIGYINGNFVGQHSSAVTTKPSGTHGMIGRIMVANINVDPVTYWGPATIRISSVLADNEI